MLRSAIRRSHVLRWEDPSPHSAGARMYYGIRTTPLCSLVSTTVGGFTLIEVLVVIGIVGLLLGVLVPSLSAARGQAKRAQCLSNLRSLAAAGAAYANEDARDLVLPAHPISDINPLHDEGFFDYGGATGADDVWNGLRYGAASQRSAITRPMNVFLYKNVTDRESFQLFRCPDDEGLPAQTQGSQDLFWAPSMQVQSMFSSVGTSYGGNAYRGTEQVHGSLQYFSVGPFLRSSSRIPAPGSVVLFYEAVMWYNIIFVPEGTSSSFLWQGLRGWHDPQPRYSLAFADGHADTLRIPSGRLWEYDATSDPEYDNLWLRGPGFRFDCRPSPLISDPPLEVSHP